MLQWLQENWELIATGIGGAMVGLATQLRKWWSDGEQAESDFREQLISRVDSLEGRCDTLQRQQTRMTQRVLELSRERDALQRQLDAVEERANHAERTVAELRGKIDAKNREIHQLQTRLGRLEERGEPIE